MDLGIWRSCISIQIVSAKFNDQFSMKENSDDDCHRYTHTNLLAQKLISSQRQKLFVPNSEIYSVRVTLDEILCFDSTELQRNHNSLYLANWSR